jgi:hypothetical protein
MVNDAVNDGKPTKIFNDEGLLTFSTGGQNGDLPLASKEDYEQGDRCEGSIFEALEPGENIKLADGYFVLDEELDLVQDWQII